MKGTITTCLAEMVEKKFGADRWQTILAVANVDARSRALLKVAIADVPDHVVVQLLEATARVLGITAEKAADAFGEYWCCEYAPNTYKAVVARFKDARQTILDLDTLHVRMTAAMPNARPPRFDYKWIDEQTLQVTYKSHRSLIGVYMGLARGVGKYFGETLKVWESGRNNVIIQFG
jgi:hypothetical protein